MFDSSKLDKLCEICNLDMCNLPKRNRDVRVDSLHAWCILYKADNLFKLPFYWRMACTALLYGLRLHRVGVRGKRRSEEVSSFCKEFVEFLWDKHSRKTCYMISIGAEQKESPV